MKKLVPISDADTRQGVAVSRPQFPDRGYCLDRYRDERVCAAQNLRNGYGYLVAYGGWKSVADGSMQPGCRIGQGGEDYP